MFFGIKEASPELNIVFLVKNEATAFPSVPALRITRLTESIAVYMMIPQSRGVMRSLTCMIPVSTPAAIPAANEIIRQSQGSTPWIIRTPLSTAPSGNVPSTDRSGKSRIL